MELSPGGGIGRRDRLRTYWDYPVGVRVSPWAPKNPVIAGFFGEAN